MEQYYKLYRVKELADNDGDDATIDCAELAIWDVALTAEQVA